MNTESENKQTVRRARPLKLRVHHVLRWLHIYLSMISLLIVLFFSLTGVTLNHPEWSFGTRETKREVEGKFPTNWKNAGGPDWFVVAEYLRTTYNLRGQVKDNHSDDREGSLAFKAPGYSADCFFDTRTGGYTMSISSQGPLNLLNDLHRGRDTARAWNWTVDASAVILILVSLTGLGITFFLLKLRRSALIWAGVGCLLTWILMRIAG